MTKFQALFVLYLRNKNKCNCSWRAVAAHFYNRYHYKIGDFYPLKHFNDRKSFEFMTYGGNQLDGIELCREAAKILGYKSDDLYDVSIK